MADTAVMPMLNQRGYHPIELTSVMFRALDVAEASDTKEKTRHLRTRVISPDEVELWARISAAGWATEHESLADFMYGFGSISAQCRGAYPYIAEIADEAIATGMLFIQGQVALIAGASTVPHGRNKGAQNALLAARLGFAAGRGCILAVMGASPGSQSQKIHRKTGSI